MTSAPLPPLSSRLESLAVICPSWIGDCVMATPVYRALRQGLPRTRITAVLRPGLDEVLRGNPWFDEMVVCDMKGFAEPLRAGRILRKMRAQAALLLPNSFRSALAARFSGAPIRIGYARDGRGWLLTHKKSALKADVPVPAVNYYAELVEFALGLEAIDRRLELFITDQEQSQADRILQGVAHPFALLNPGANRADKRWPAPRFAAVADALAGSRKLSAVITGSLKERDVLAAVVQHAKSPIVNLLDRGITLGALKAVIKQAAVVITNDTGPRHIAAALGTPVVTLFGPTDHRWTTLENVRERMLLAEPFLPGQLVADRHANACAIEKISVGDVLAAVENLLGPQKLEHSASLRA